MNKRNYIIPEIGLMRLLAGCAGSQEGPSPASPASGGPPRRLDRTTVGDLGQQKIKKSSI